MRTWTRSTLPAFPSILLSGESMLSIHRGGQAVARALGGIHLMVLLQLHLKLVAVNAGDRYVPHHNLLLRPFLTCPAERMYNTAGGSCLGSGCQGRLRRLTASWRSLLSALSAATLRPSEALMWPMCWHTVRGLCSNAWTARCTEISCLLSVSVPAAILLVS